MTDLYAFILRPISGFHVPTGVAIMTQDTSVKRARVHLPGDPPESTHPFPQRPKDADTRCHGVATLSRELTAAEQRQCDVYPVVHVIAEAQ